MRNRRPHSLLHGISWCVLVVATILSPSPALAAEWSAHAAATSNYLSRGLTRSRNSGAFQLNIGLQDQRGWAAGVWASTIELYEGAGREVELDYYIAGDWALSRDWRANAQLTRYEFTGDLRAMSYDYTEAAVALSFRDSLSAAIAISPDYSSYSYWGYAKESTMVSYELLARRPVNRLLQLTAGVGRSELGGDAGGGYWYWNGGGALAWDRVNISLSYVTSDGTARRLFRQAAARDAWIATIAFRLL